MQEEEAHWFRKVEYRLYPNATQAKTLKGILDECGKLYNTLLDHEIDRVGSGETKSTTFDLNNLAKTISDGDPALKATVYSKTRYDVARRVHAAVKGYFINADGKDVHKPRHKKSNRYHSFSYPSDQGFGFKGDRLWLSKVGNIRYRNDHVPSGGTPRECLVARRAGGKWYATITYRVPALGKAEELIEHPSKAEGYDLGTKNIITDTEGNAVEVPDFYRQREDEIGEIQARMSALEKDSPEWESERERLAVVHRDISLKRRGFLHRLSRSMIRGHSVIAMEDVNVRKLIERKDHGPGMNKDFMEASWGRLVGMVGYKAEEACVSLRLVNPGYTSLTCSGCGNVKEELPLSVRVYCCEECGLVIDRDRNAAINILRKGLVMQPTEGRRDRPHQRDRVRRRQLPPPTRRSPSI